jgi:hypothetical protein
MEKARDGFGVLQGGCPIQCRTPLLNSQVYSAAVFET